MEYYWLLLEENDITHQHSTLGDWGGGGEVMKETQRNLFFEGGGRFQGWRRFTRKEWILVVYGVESRRFGAKLEDMRPLWRNDGGLREGGACVSSFDTSTRIQLKKVVC